MRILLILNLLSFSALGAAIYFTMPEIKYFERNLKEVETMYRGNCREAAYGRRETTEWNSLKNEAAQFEMNTVVHLPDTIDVNKKANYTAVNCRYEYAGFVVGVNNPNSYGPTHIKLSNPLFRPIELEVESGEIYVESVHVQVSLHEAPQHLLITSKNFVQFMVAGGEVNTLTLNLGDLYIETRPSIEEASGFARVLKILAGPESTVYLNGKKALGPGQYGNLLPSGFSAVSQTMVPPPPPPPPFPAVAPAPAKAPPSPKRAH